MGIGNFINETQKAAQNINISGETLKEESLNLIGKAREPLLETSR